MRDVLVTLIVFGSLPYIFKRPYLGAIMWAWISIMNPHSQGWGFARTFPFAAIIAVVTLLSLLASKEKKALPMPPVTVVFLILMVWMSITTLFAIHGPEQSYFQWVKVNKIFGMTIVVLCLLKERKHVEMMMWTVVVSLGFYGVKGGIFTIASGGSDRVWGPEGTFIEGNNELALALVMVIPLMYYLHGQLVKRWQRQLMLASMFLSALAALGSYSRGAALALGAMLFALWLKSKNKATLGILMLCTVPVLLLFMPKQWFNRIDTINTYEEDGSAMGRINAWKMAWNLAQDRFFGGGFDIYDTMVFKLYAPKPEDVHAAHSIYFQMLGEHGFIGLFLYMAIGFLSWHTGSWIIRNTKGRAELKWAHDLGTMVQVSLLGFSVGGIFLSLAYFDVPYYLMACLIVTRVIVEKELRAAAQAPAAAPAAPEAAPGEAAPAAPS